MPSCSEIALRDAPLALRRAILTLPGERFNYSNSGYLLLGYIIERASGEKYEDFLRKNIYEPVGMLDSGYAHPQLILKDRASGYSRDNSHTVNASYMEMDTPFAGGWMYSQSGALPQGTTSSRTAKPTHCRVEGRPRGGRNPCRCRQGQKPS